MSFYSESKSASNEVILFKSATVMTQCVKYDFLKSLCCDVLRRGDQTRCNKNNYIQTNDLILKNSVEECYKRPPDELIDATSYTHTR